MIASFIYVLFAGIFLQEPSEPVEIPAVRPATDFYSGAGAGIRLRFEVSQSPIPVGEWFELRLLIEGLLNPSQAIVPDLRTIPEFQEAFEIRDPQLLKPKITENRWEVSYSIRARTDSVKAIPALKYRYYNPRANTGRLNLDFPTTQSPSVPIQVEAIHRPPPPKEPMDIPPEWIEPVTENRPFGIIVSRQSWFYFVILGPLAFLMIALAIAWYLPNDRRRRERLRSRAGRQAMRRLQSLTQTDHLAEAIHLIVWGYIAERSSVPLPAKSLAVIAAHADPLRLPPEPLRQLQEFLSSLEQYRFAPTTNPPDLLDKAIQLMTRLEESNL